MTIRTISMGPMGPKKYTLAVVIALAAASLSACAQDGGGGTGSVGIGTVAGAAGGAAVSRAIFGKSNATAALLGGAAVGGLAGNVLVDRPADEKRQENVEASRDRSMQRQLEYERQSALQQEEVRRQIEEQRLFEEWKRERGVN